MKTEALLSGSTCVLASSCFVWSPSGGKAEIHAKFSITRMETQHTERYYHNSMWSTTFVRSKQEELSGFSPNDNTRKCVKSCVKSRLNVVGVDVEGVEKGVEAGPKLL